ncbi:hypothetical protein V5O48_014747 [Marasmius crinis-equi]|uniref:Integrase catalytic domain-containing protein n=1 Tax=Marasmius crinis-equi TaxID=585013 RepID=A0ABR3EWG1_9AGAR
MDDSQNNTEAPDRTHSFLLHAETVVKEAARIADSLPNAEEFAVERAMRRLLRVFHILSNLDDEHITPEECETLVQVIVDIASPLSEFLQQPPSTQPNVRFIYTGKPGRPRYQLNLNRLVELHNLGCTWDTIASAVGVTRQTLYNHLSAAGLSKERPSYDIIADDDLDELVASISLLHPLAGSVIIVAHLEAHGFKVPLLRVQESLRRVDAIGVFVRWSGCIKRRVYKVWGSNALWHHDGNEKLRPWGFYIHGCVDGHSRLMIYMHCCNNKRAAVVGMIFKKAVDTYGWPSRMRGDFGRENNEVERLMIAKWGENHHAYLRGRSTQNVRIERAWRDVRKDTIESFRKVFEYLTEVNLLDMEDPVHRICLYVIYQPRIQASLNRTMASWNHHRMRTAKNKSPLALYELSREVAINRGYWTGDPGDDLATASDPSYGQEDGDLPPLDELRADPQHPEYQEYESRAQEKADGVYVNDDEEIVEGREFFAAQGFDTTRDDQNWGIDVYCEAILLMEQYMQSL